MTFGAKDSKPGFMHVNYPNTCNLNHMTALIHMYSGSCKLRRVPVYKLATVGKNKPLVLATLNFFRHWLCS